MTVDVVGNVAADIFVASDHFPPGTAGEFGPASLVVTRRAARLEVGGNAARTAAILGRLGLPVRLHTSLGLDVWGTWVREQVGAAGVEVLGTAGGDTATNIVATDGTGCRLSFFHPGAGDDGAPQPLPDTAFLVVAACPFPEPGRLRRWLPAFLDAAVPVLIDLGPPLFDRLGLSQLADLAGPLVHLTMNEAGLGELTRCRDSRGGLGQLHRLGFASLVVKLGRRGALVSTASSQRAWHVPAEPLPGAQRSTVGAGDSFNAGLVYGLLSGFDVARSAALGNRVAWRTCSAAAEGPGEPGQMISHLDDDCKHIEEG